MRDFFYNWILFWKIVHYNYVNLLCIFLNVKMATNQLIAELNKDNKLNEKNCDLWKIKVTFLLNDQELTKHAETSRVPPVMAEGVIEAQHCRALDAYTAWYKRDSHALVILLSSMDNDLMVEYQQY